MREWKRQWKPQLFGWFRARTKDIQKNQLIPDCTFEIVRNVSIFSAMGLT